MKIGKITVRKRGIGVYVAVGLLGLLGATQGDGGCGGCKGGCDFTPPPPPKDAVWCDVTAVPCAIDFNGQCSQPACTVNATCTTNADNRTFCDPRVTTCTKMSATGTTGQRLCFDSTKHSPQEVCKNACINCPLDSGGFCLQESMWPLDLTLNAITGAGCTGTINTGTSHPTYDGTGGGSTTPNFQKNGCSTDGPALPGYHPLTNAVALGGAGTVQSAGNNIPPHPINIKGGHFNLSAPKTSCGVFDTDCQVVVHEAEMDFDDIEGDTGNVGPGGTHAFRSPRMFLDNPFLTPSGTFFPAGGGLPATFSFPLPPGVVFDGIGVGDGFLLGTTVSSDQELNATINLATGALVYDFDLRETVNGSLVELNGTATTAAVVEIAPVLTTPTTSISIDSPGACAANVTLTASASSPVASPVRIDYGIDKPAQNKLDGGGSALFSVPVGTHTATIAARDGNGGETRAVITVNVNDRTPPVFDNPPASQTVQGCSNASGAVHVTAPTAHNQCGPGAATVTGTVIQFNGSTVSIPIVNGTVNLPAGTGVIRWVATSPSGATATFDQTLVVVAPTTFFGKAGVSIADRSIVNGSVFSGAGGQATVGNDSAINGNLISASPVILRDRTTVTFIDTNAGLTRGSNDHIGSVSTATPVLPAFPVINQTFTGTVAVVVNPDATRTLAPGQYGAVTVFSRGKLILSGGVYAFTSLDLEPQASIIVPSSTVETAQVFVRDSVIYRGRTTIASGTIAPLFLGYTGSNAITIENVYSGTIIASNASLTLQSLNNTGVYTGEFFGRQVTLSPATTTNSSPFTCH